MQPKQDRVSVSGSEQHTRATRLPALASPFPARQAGNAPLGLPVVSVKVQLQGRQSASLTVSRSVQTSRGRKVQVKRQFLKYQLTFWGEMGGQDPFRSLSSPNYFHDNAKIISPHWQRCELMVQKQCWEKLLVFSQKITAVTPNCVLAMASSLGFI